MKKLLNQLEAHAKLRYDGHYTILRFTTHFKVAFGTVTDRKDIEALEGFETLKSAIINCLLNEVL